MASFPDCPELSRLITESDVRTELTIVTLRTRSIFGIDHVPIGIDAKHQDTGFGTDLDQVATGIGCGRYRQHCLHDHKHAEQDGKEFPLAPLQPLLRSGDMRVLLHPDPNRVLHFSTTLNPRRHP
ncbi:hypothetical protein [Aliiruegeria lutimaris]|uniref:hypothetical protein n=1 Tax=Aliiruegeria lutimaris TaxID=571298 RepID=UPI0011134F80|nr:hypothetical protein [Aliiruegeria lutimaris]